MPIERINENSFLGPTPIEPTAESGKLDLEQRKNNGGKAKSKFQELLEKAEKELKKKEKEKNLPQK